MKNKQKSVINRVKRVFEKISIGSSIEEQIEGHLAVFSDIGYKSDPGIIARVCVDVDNDSKYLRTQIAFKEPVPNEFAIQVDELIVRLNFFPGIGHLIRFPETNRLSFAHAIILENFAFDEIEFEKLIRVLLGNGCEMYKAMRGLTENQIPLETIIQKFEKTVKHI